MSKLRYVRNIINKRRSLPLYLIFGVTNTCNSRCLTCFNWRQTDSAKDELSLEAIDKIASSMPQPLLTLVFTGGEVFLRKELVDIVSIFRRRVNPQFLAIPTNGIQFKEIAESVRKILSVFENNVAINISLDGIGELHDRIRGVPGNFDKAEKLYHALSLIKAEEPRLSLGINTVLNNLNQDRYEEIFSYVRANYPAIDQHNFEIMRGNFRDANIHPPSAEFLKLNTAKLQKMIDVYDYHKSGIYRKFLHAAKVHYHSVVLDHVLKTRSLPCYAGSLAGVIDHKGNVYPCELLDSIGNLKDFAYDFPSLWFSARADEVRKTIRETRCVCTHSCFQFVNILFNPFEYPRLLRPMQSRHHIKDRR